MMILSPFSVQLQFKSRLDDIETTTTKKEETRKNVSHKKGTGVLK